MFEQFLEGVRKDLTSGDDLTGKFTTAILTLFGLFALVIGKKFLTYAGKKTWAGAKGLQETWFAPGPVAKEILTALDDGQVVVPAPFRTVMHEAFSLHLGELGGMTVYQEGENITEELSKRDKRKVSRKAWALVKEVEESEKAAETQARAKRIHAASKGLLKAQYGDSGCIAACSPEQDCDCCEEEMAKAIKAQDLKEEKKQEDLRCHGTAKSEVLKKPELTTEEIHKLLEESMASRRKNGKA